jgi:hypothetical protein
MKLTFEQVLALLGLVLPLLIPVGQVLFHFLVGKLPGDVQSKLASLADVAVKATEQAGKGMTSEEKKANAAAAVKELAGALGLQKYATDSAVSALIEAAVYALNAAHEVSQSASEPSAVQPGN